ncbi:FDXHR family putative zinc-binding protein [Microlunatus antarcticus]|uniref:Phage FDXHR zinc binding domain-containing protein n=1 Tax=Microlunatus antarcticus TaxID=53388 RepID=A0A7W5P5K9_9ACTN|nr:hypothetical protein [Microlunatus antarcticus]
MTRCNGCSSTYSGTTVSHCTSCHESFSNAFAGDRHRIGDHGVKVGPDRRRCRTADEMLEAGLVLNARGCWTRARLDVSPLALRGAGSARGYLRYRSAPAGLGAPNGPSPSGIPVGDAA